MAEQLVMVGNSHIKNLIDESITDLTVGKGNIIALSGESSFGKTHILNYYYEKHLNNSRYKTVITEGQAPIGNFNLGNIQALLPISKAIEKILQDQNITPEKRFAKNLGLTVLASIPIIDTVFYAVKEIGKDWRQFKQEKSTEENRDANALILDYLDTLYSLAHKIPLIILIDDIHWADPMTVELLNHLAENITDHKILLILSYKKSILDTQGLPFNTFLLKNQTVAGVHFVNIETLELTQISDLSSIFIDNYKGNAEFEKWIFEKSLGVPGIASEYLKYFNRFSPFDTEGNLATNFEGNEFLPDSVQTVFAQHIETLTDEEQNILAACSVEGLEFTALISSQLLNVDLLTCIKKLKHLQQKTGLIKSIGAHTKYGVKTTVYRFTQQFYHTFFENSLEYEESVALHTEVANILKERYEQSDSEAMKEEIAPYLAAHSSASGDDDTAKSMLLATAQFSEKYGHTDLLDSVYEKFEKIRTDNEDDKLIDFHISQLVSNSKEQNSDSDTDNSYIHEVNLSENSSELNINLLDFSLFRKAIENDIINSNYEPAITKSKHILNSKDNLLSNSEVLQIKTLLIKAYLGNNETVEAETIIFELENTATEEDEQNRCLIYNIAAQYYTSTDNLSKAYYFLEKASSLIQYLPHELRLLTLANIGKIRRKTSSERYKEYILAAKNLSTALNYSKLSEDLSRLI